MKDAILSAAIDVIALHGLNNWTVEEVANRAHCAKGLVNYHYRSKQDLLVVSANTLRDDRSARRLAAAGTHGSAALDRLWDALAAEVESGWFAAWTSLLASDGPLRRAAAEKPEEVATFTATLSKSLGLGDQLLGQTQVIQATLDGVQLLLLQGRRKEETLEAYHQFWLSVLAA